MLLTISPCIDADQDSLTARTSAVVLFLTLGLMQRKVRLDRVTRTVSIGERFGWFWKRYRVFSFDEIAAVTYGYEEMLSLGFGARDPMDKFVVGIRPRVGDEVALFWFVGDGSFTNDGPMPDWWYWKEYVFDFTGRQEQESRMFAKLLSKLLNVTLVPSSLTREFC